MRNYFPNCVCLRDNSGFECSSAFDQPDSFKLVTHETLLNISGSNESDYYLYTTELYRLKRYGGLSFDNEQPPPSKAHTDDEAQLRGGRRRRSKLVQNLAKPRVARVWYNNKGFHAMPTFLGVMNNALLRANVLRRLRSKRTNATAGDDDDHERTMLLEASRYGITVINHPMNQTNNYLSTEYLLQGSDVLISIFTIVAMSFVNASFVLFLVYERANRSLHLQFLVGLNPLLYWITNFTWDMINYLLPASCVIVIFKVKSKSSLAKC